MSSDGDVEYLMRWVRELQDSVTFLAAEIERLKWDLADVKRESVDFLGLRCD